MLASHLPRPPTCNNPVDVIGDASQERYENALSAVIKDEGVDGALVILTPQSMTNALGTAEAIVRIARRSAKPIVCCFMGIMDVSAGVKYLQENGIPVYQVPRKRAPRPSGHFTVTRAGSTARSCARSSSSMTARARPRSSPTAWPPGRTYLGEARRARVAGVLWLQRAAHPRWPTAPRRPWLSPRRSAIRW